MKLDKIRFAWLINYLVRHCGADIGAVDMQEIDNIVDVEVPAPQLAEASKVDELLKQLNAPDGFIPAIKAYRALTGAGLKEAKEAIERYRTVPKYRDDPEPKNATLGDILKTATNN